MGYQTTTQSNLLGFMQGAFMWINPIPDLVGVTGNHKKRTSSVIQANLQHSTGKVLGRYCCHIKTENLRICQLIYNRSSEVSRICINFLKRINTRTLHNVYFRDLMHLKLSSTSIPLVRHFEVKMTNHRKEWTINSYSKNMSQNTQYRDGSMNIPCWNTQFCYSNMFSK